HDPERGLAAAVGRRRTAGQLYGGQLVGHRILLVVATCAAVLVSATVAAASSRQFTMVEAPDELLFSDSPDQALDLIHELGAQAIRIQVNWRRVAPEPDAKAAPSFNQTDPAAYPPGAWE